MFIKLSRSQPVNLDRALILTLSGNLFYRTGNITLRSTDPPLSGGERACMYCNAALQQINAMIYYATQHSENAKESVQLLPNSWDLSFVSDFLNIFSKTSRVNLF